MTSDYLVRFFIHQANIYKFGVPYQLEDQDTHRLR